MTTLAQIDKNISKIKGISSNVNALIQDTAVAILTHAKNHGDCTRALALVQAMPSTMRREMLVNWFAYYGPIGMNTKEGKVKLIDPKSNRWRPFDIDGAKVNPWNVAESVPANKKPERIPDTLLEFNTRFIRFIERQRKTMEDENMFDQQYRKDAEKLVGQMEDLVKKSMRGADVYRLEQELAKAKSELTGFDTYERRPQTGEITSAATGERSGEVAAPEGTGATVQHGKRKTRQQGQRSSAAADAKADTTSTIEGAAKSAAA